MNDQKIYRINSPTIIHEIIDGEAVIINMELGYYYSIDQTGAVIWDLVNKHASETEIVESISRSYTGDQNIIRSSVSDFIIELQRENLIIPASEGSDEQFYIENLDASGAAPPYTKPELIKYTDMQDLLLLDPIHEVDETGWPNVDPEIT